MQRISAESVPRTLTGYPTAIEAIRAGQQDTASWLAQTGVASCFGQRIEEACWTEERVLLRLISGDVIGIWCGESGVVCELADPNTIAPTDRATNKDSLVEILLGNMPIRWDRDLLIQSLAGRALSNMQMSGPALFFYAQGLPIICFTVMRNRDTDNLFLFWDESD